MSEARWKITLLSAEHDCVQFDCGKAPLNDFLRKFALVNQNLGISRTFAATGPSDCRVVGYYCISAGSVSFAHVDEQLRRGLPKYPVPVCLIGRMAVDKGTQGKGLGETLLFDAFERIIRAADLVAIHAVEVHAKDEGARSFYLKYGFSPLQDDKLHLYLPVNRIRKLGLV